jgi:hypothetical protein
MNETDIEKELDGLRGYRQRHQNLAKEMLSAYDGAIYPLDLLATATLHRSINLIFGFCDLVQRRNVICATPLLRLQIDNCIRFFASFIVENPHEFAMSIIRGRQIKHIKDEQGQLMTDSYLLKKLSKYEPWIEKVYKEASGWVHLSDKHIFNVYKISGDNTLEGFIGLEDRLIPDSLYLEEINAFKAATELLLKHVCGWVYTKNNPHLVQKAKQDFQKKFGHSLKY